MLEPAKIKEFLDYVNRLNNALDLVGFNGKFIPGTLYPRVGFVIGPSAAQIVRHLHLSQKLKSYYEVRRTKRTKPSYAIEIED